MPALPGDPIVFQSRRRKVHRAWPTETKTETGATFCGKGTRDMTRIDLPQPGTADFCAQCFTSPKYHP